MPRVFISYAREDSETAKKLYADLKLRGFRPWIDSEDLLPGQRWKTEVRARIRRASHFIVLLSSRAVDKRGFIQAEIEEAFEQLNAFPETAIFLIPVRVDECRPSHQRLRDLNWVDLFPDYASGLARIVAALRANCSPEPITIKTKDRASAAEVRASGDPKALLRPMDQRIQTGPIATSGRNALGGILTRIRTKLMKEYQNIGREYDGLPDRTKFWGLLELEGSREHRLSRGARKGYKRSETFRALIAEVMKPAAELEMIEGIDDAVALASDTFRPLLEAFLIIDQISTEIASEVGSEVFPFVIQGAIGFGSTKSVYSSRKRYYIGLPLDQLALVLRCESSRAPNLFITEEVYEANLAILREYSDFLAVVELHSVVSAKKRGVNYRALIVDRSAASNFVDGFAVWRSE